MSVHAPFNFVPLADTVVLPEWGMNVSHDLPFRDGASGVLKFTLKNETELIVGAGTQQQDVQQFLLPDGRPAIPGSSLRGMIRAVLEVATFSRFRQVDDSRFGVRDLTSGARPFYGEVVSRRVNGAFMALSQGGWLSFDGRNWSITPCEVARLEHDDLAVLTGDVWWREVPRDPAGNSEKKYDRFDAWAARTGLTSRQIYFQQGEIADHQHSQGKLLRYRRASTLSAAPGPMLIPGTPVFTGQPAQRVPGGTGKKHLEFIFSGSGIPVSISARVMSGFLQIHESSAEWQRMKNDARIPVFYLESSAGEIESLGLAQMYKLPYKNTVHEVIRHTSLEHLEESSPDFCDLLFGRTHDAPDASLKSRAWFEPAVAPRVGSLPARTVVLSSPKPSYYPSYVRQDARNGQLIDGYTTWSDANAQLRGWKRYPARPNVTEGLPATDRVATTLHPLPAGTCFEGRLVFHNLKRVELGAILWALTWGGDSTLCHSIGMGKPYGYGAARFEIDDRAPLEIEWNDRSQTETLSVDSLRRSFVEYMTQRVRNWSATPQMIALRAMANPSTATRFDLTYMTLNPEQHRNDFQAAKRQPHQALPEYPGVPVVPAHAQPWVGRSPEPPNPVVPSGPEVWHGVPLTSERQGGTLMVIAREQHKEATETMTALRQKIAPQQASALEEAERRWKKGRAVTADVTVHTLGGTRYKIIELTFRS
jgi:hypothetical protein